MRQPKLLERILPNVVDCLNAYVQNDYVCCAEKYIVAAGLGDNAGIAGALALAERACRSYDLAVSAAE